MFGCVPRLPVDAMFGQFLHDPVVVDHSTYLKSLMSQQAKGYNKRVKGICLNIGDRVLVENKGERGKRKLSDKWDSVVYTVIDRNLQTHTYKIKDENGRVKVVHRNMVLDISFLPVESSDEERIIPVSVSESDDGTCYNGDEITMEDFDSVNSGGVIINLEDKEIGSLVVSKFETSLAQDTDAEKDLESDQLDMIGGESSN